MTTKLTSALKLAVSYYSNTLEVQYNLLRSLYCKVNAECVSELIFEIGQL